MVGRQAATAALGIVVGLVLCVGWCGDRPGPSSEGTVSRTPCADCTISRKADPLTPSVEPLVQVATAPINYTASPAELASNKTTVSTEVKRSRAQLASMGIFIKPAGSWNVGICSGTKNSGAWMREWIELHLLSGVDHIWIGNDNDEDTEDGTQAVLEFYQELGFVTILPGRMPKQLPECGWKGTKRSIESDCAAPKWCAMHASNQVDWLIFADTDEFVFPQSRCSLSDYVKSTCSRSEASVTLPWERFGTSRFSYHPAGLITENFLESGGDCSTLEDRAYKDKEGCTTPYGFCGECRNFKQMYNTGRCARVEHIGWVHFPVNTSIWLQMPRTKQQWKSAGNTINEVPFKNPECFYNHESVSANKCVEWELKGGGQHEQPVYDQGCCAAGIGYHHYGTKSLEYYLRKQLRANKNDGQRGFFARRNAIDLHGTINPAILKYTRALKRRFKAMGVATSASSYFVDVNTAAGKRACFVERGKSYVPRLQHGVKTSIVKQAETPSECCAVCFAEKACKAWSLMKTGCTLLLPSQFVTRYNKATQRRPNPRSHIPAEREHSDTVISGIPVHTECWV